MDIHQQHHQGTLHILDATGDTTLAWDVTDEASVAEVRARFDEIVSRGYTAVATKAGEQGIQGRRLTSFDPQAERIAMHRRIVGG